MTLGPAALALLWLSCASADAAPPTDAVALDPFAAGPPPVVDSGPLTFPVPQRLELPDGTPVWLVHRPEVPLVHVTVTLQSGLASATDRHALALAAAVVARGEGTADLAPQDWSAALSQAGVQLSVGVGTQASWLDVDLLPGREQDGLTLALAALQRPSLTGGAVRSQRRLAAEQADAAARAPGALHQVAVQRTLYAPGHPLGDLATGRDLRDVTGKRVRAAWLDLLQQGAVGVVVVGDTTAQRILPVLAQALGSLPGAGRPVAPPRALAPPVAGPRHVLVDTPGLTRSFISVLIPVPGFDHLDAPVYDLLNRALAAEFDSRLSQLLREDKGWTYGVHGMLHSWPGHGVIEVRCAVAADVTAQAMAAIQDELETLVAHPPQGDELARVQAAVRRDAALRLLRNGRLSWQLAGEQARGRAPEAAAEDLARVDAVTARRMAAVAGRIAVDRALWVVTGDREQVEPQLDAAGLPLDSIRGAWTVVDGHAPLPL